MANDSPSHRWEEAGDAIQGLPFTPVSAEDFMVAITAALTQFDWDKGVGAPDIERARDCAHSCAETGFLLSPIEKLYLSIAVLGCVKDLDDPRDEELQFHHLWWDRAVTSIKDRHYPAATQLLLMVCGQLINAEKYAHVNFLLQRIEQYLVSLPDEISIQDLSDFDGVRNALSRWFHHPARGNFPPLPPSS